MLKPWHQQWEVYEGVFTPERNPVRDLIVYAGFPKDLSGKTVLDNGVWNGWHGSRREDPVQDTDAQAGCFLATLTARCRSSLKTNSFTRI